MTDEEEVRDLYERAWTQHGATAEGMGWASAEEQANRFRLIAEQLDRGASPLSILDVGCGDGKFYIFLYTGYNQFRYTGVDQNKAALDHAKKVKVRDGDYTPNYILGEFLTLPALPSTYDYCVASGTLNYYNIDRQFQIVRKMWDLCRVGVVFNSRDVGYITLRSWAHMFKAEEWMMRGGYIPNSTEITAAFWKVPYPR